MTLISIVSGTWNRLPLLKQMMHSVRVQMLPGIDYEFVLIDGGSTDGTLDYLRQQPDVVLIEEGELTGAIKAFTRAAYAASGDYVVIANDDVVFMPYSLLTAAAYLEDTPSCGIVAFEDNRPPNSPTGYSVQTHAVKDADGNRIGQPYAQVGMVRRWLGDAVGWWGADDPIMSKSHTYGGDNYLSARVWEAGYTVDLVKGCRIHDYIALDDLRTTNSERTQEDAGAFYERFPGGAEFNTLAVTPPQPDDRLRVLYLSLHEEGYGASLIHKHGLRNALGKLGIVAEYDYVGREANGANIRREILTLAQSLKPHVLYTQIHQANPRLVETIRMFRGENPNAVCINWNGDYWPEKALHPDSIELLRYYDAALVVNASIIPEYETHGIYAAYVQDASEAPDELPDMPAYDVLFIGNQYSGARAELGKLLKSLPYKVGIFGLNWNGLEDGQTYYRFDVTHALIKNATITIGDMQFPDATAYVSNRFFNTLHAGGFHLQQVIPGFDEATGYKAGRHYATWTDLDDLLEQIAYWLSHDKEREKIRKAGQNYTRRYQSYDARVKQVFTKVLPPLLERKAKAAQHAMELYEYQDIIT